MVVKNWGFGETGSDPGNEPWQYKFVVGVGGEMVPPPAGAFGDLSNASGTNGQNTSTPVEKVFAFHFIVQVPTISNLFYDPSYGVTYLSESDFESTALAGYASQLAGDSGTNYHFRPSIVSPPLPTNIKFLRNPNNSM
jgi:hypothetical protein